MPNPLHDALLAPHAMSDAPFLRLMDGAVVTYRTFLAESARLAHALVAAGLEPGDRLAAQIAKSPEALALYAACLQAGIVFLPLNTA
jgi:malonyl-CoA/methylmalonyl-CoA synthetase